MVQEREDEMRVDFGNEPYNQYGEYDYFGSDGRWHYNEEWNAAADRSNEWTQNEERN